MNIENNLVNARSLEQGGKTDFPFDEYLINVWQKVEKGLQFIRISETIMVTRENEGKLPITISFDVLKFEPKYFEFSVYGTVIDKTVKRSIYGWLRDYNLLAVINASMYLPDNISSIGYLKKKDKFSNTHIGKNLGAFFVANPYEKFKGKIPDVAIIYSNDPQFSRFITKNEKHDIITILNKYQVVVQNFQLLELTNNKNKLWAGQRRHSIASLGEDTQGNILLMYASTPITINDFITVLRKSSQLKIKRAMYLEGGTEASMLYQGKKTYLWQVNDNIKLFLKGIILLPNVIGIKKK